MSNDESRARLASDPAALNRAEHVLEAYPDVEEADIRFVAQFFRSASSLDVGLLSANKPAWAAADAMRRDRPDLFRTTLRSWMTLLIVTGAAFAVLGGAIVADMG